MARASEPEDVLDPDLAHRPVRSQLLAEAGEVDTGRLRLSDHRAKHIVKVLRAEVGDRVRVGLIDDKMGSGIILAIKKKKLQPLPLQEILIRV